MSDASSERLGRVEEVFHAALERPPAEREAFVREACGDDEDLRLRVERLIRADGESGGPLSEPVAPIAALGRGQEHGEDLSGQRVGAYRLVRRLGEGGMGSVWLGERDDAEFERRVAIKVIKRGMDTDEVLRRFRVERRALAGLEHPCIARLIDAATTADGRPALVMEYVDGEPLDTHCESRDLPVRARLDLFLRVCEAVEHAHRQLVVHRDIKPSNIYVTPEGTPKLFDFGIAKLLSPDEDLQTRTSTEQRVLTPRYASPEQVRGERVTTATDVFSLGVVLYELLTGRAPFESPSGSRAELQRMICEQEPARPSTAVTRATGASAGGSGERDPSAPISISTPRLRRELEGDLDTIVLMALRKEPERRYRSVADLADDIRRHLNDLPVRARPDTVGYRAAKFVRRNRGAVLAGTTVLVLLVAGLSVMTWLYTRTREAEIAEHDQRQEALIRLDEADSVASFLEDMLASATPDRAAGRDPEVLLEILDAAEARVDRELHDQPRVRARIQHTLGSSYRLVGSYDKAERHLEDAERLVVGLHGPESIQAAQVAYDRALLALDRDRQQDAQDLVESALAVFEREDTEPTMRLANAVDLLATIQLQLARFEEADRLQSRAISLYEQAGAPDNEPLMQAYGKRAVLLAQLGRDEEGIALLRSAIDQAHIASSPPSMTRLALMNNLAVLYRRAGRLDEALDVYDSIIETGDALLGPDHRLAMVPRSNRGAVLHRMGRLDEAESQLGAIAAAQEAALGERHDDTITSIFNHGQVLADMGRIEEAVGKLRRVLELNLATAGESHPKTLFSRGALGRTLVRSEDAADIDEGRRLLAEAVRDMERVLGSDHPATAGTRRSLDALDQPEAIGSGETPEPVSD